MNILKMAREGLRRELTTALHKAIAQKEPVHQPGIRVKTNGSFTIVDLTVRPVPAGPGAAAEPNLYLVILAESPPPPAEPERPETSVAADSVEGHKSAADSERDCRHPQAGTAGQRGIPPDHHRGTGDLQRGTQVLQRGDAVGQ